MSLTETSLTQAGIDQAWLREVIAIGNCNLVVIRTYKLRFASLDEGYNTPMAIAGLGVAIWLRTKVARYKLMELMCQRQ